MLEIIARRPGLTRIRTDARLWQFFGDHKISFGPHDWRHIPEMEIPHDCRLEEHTLFNNGGHTLTSMGIGSYQMTHATVGAMGRYCSVAAFVDTMGERHPIEHVTTSPITYRYGEPHFDQVRRDLGITGAPVPRPNDRPLPVIGHDVWIGDGALLARGITLGHGCIVGARAVVTKDVAPYTIICGSPARVVRKRFPEDVIAALLDLQWWNLHPRVLFKHDIRDPRKFIEAVQRGGAEPFTPRAVGAADIMAVN